MCAAAGCGDLSAGLGAARERALGSGWDAGVSAGSRSAVRASAGLRHGAVRAAPGRGAIWPGLEPRPAEIRLSDLGLPTPGQDRRGDFL